MTLSQTEQIEYYLGKDKFKNPFFGSKKLLGAYELFNDGLRDYEKLKSTKFELLANFGLSNEFRHTIKFNNLGFRQDFDYSLEYFKKFKQIVLCLGCSDTLCPNLTDDKIWPNLLQKKLNDYYQNDDEVLVLNLGIFSGACDSVVRLLINYVNLIPNITDVCVIWPNTNRREFVSIPKKMIISGTVPLSELPFIEYWNVMDWESDSYNFHKNKILAENFCATHNIQLFDLLLNRFFEKAQFDFSSYLFALGEKSNEALSNYYFKKITKQLSKYEEVKCSN